MFLPQDPPKELQLFFRLSVLEGLGTSTFSSAMGLGGDNFRGFAN